MKNTIIIAIAALLMVSCVSFQPIVKQEKQDMIQAGLNELDLDIHVHLLPLRKQRHTLLSSGLVVEGRMSGANGLYVMQLSNNLSTIGLSRVIAHELVHAEQLETGKLKFIDAKKMSWKGRVVRNWQKISHDQRPWEKDAFKRGRVLAYKIRQQLKQ